MQGQTKKREIFHVAGDAPDPSGTGMRGMAPGYDLTATAVGHPLLFYRLPNGHELILEADVYALPGQPMYAYVICPICMMAGRTIQLAIRQEVKDMHYDPKGRVKPPPGWDANQLRETFPNGVGGQFSVDHIECTFEVTPEMRRDFGLAVCPWQVVIDNNVVIDDPK